MQSFGEVSEITRMPNSDLHVHFRRADVAEMVCPACLGTPQGITFLRYVDFAPRCTFPVSEACNYRGILALNDESSGFLRR
jgi:hypothetical protein